MSPKRTVTFHPDTNPPAEPNHIHIVADTEIHLRNSQTWIPVQIFDMISLRLRFAHSQATHYVQQPPYTTLLHTLTFLTSNPIIPSIISEIQEMHHGRPPLPSNPTPIQRKQCDLWQQFDDMHEKWIVLQRERVEASEEVGRLTKKKFKNEAHWGARMLGKITPAARRRDLNGVALREAQYRARVLETEAVEIWEGVQILEMGIGEDEDVDGVGVGEGKQGSPSPSGSSEPARKKRRLR